MNNAESQKALCTFFWMLGECLKIYSTTAKFGIEISSPRTFWSRVLKYT
jgi:hypothetical protein